MTPTEFKTLKEAYDNGYRSAADWLKRQGERKPCVPRRDAVPLIIKKKELFTADQCEEVISSYDAQRIGLFVLANAQSVRNFHGRYGNYPGFRISDCVSENEAEKVEIQDDFWSLAQLKSSGWTDSLIRRFLPEPDQTRTNRHHVTGPPVRLYKQSRVEAIEGQADFVAALQKSDKRREGAARAMATKQEKAEAYVESIVCQVPRFDMDELIRRACESFNANKSLYDISGNWTSATHDSDTEFLDRICVNYLRHEMTAYDAHLGQISGQVGANECRLQVKAKVLDAISEAYPNLASECYAQLLRAEKAQQE